MLGKRTAFLSILILILIVLSSCKPNAVSFSNEEQNAALTRVMSFFDNSQARTFKLLEPVKINDRYYITVEASGKYNKGSYPIDTFALNINNDSIYYKNHTGGYEELNNTPLYAYLMSPNGKFCIEETNIADGGDIGSGDYYLGTTRILDLDTAEVLWETNGCLREKYMWSQNSNYIARQYSGRIWTDVESIDMETFNVALLPRSDDILRVCKFTSSPASGLYEIKFNNWIAENEISIEFGWFNDNGYWIQGSYNYFVNNNSFEVVDIQEVMRG